VLEGFGDQSAARALAQSCDVALIKGINKTVSLGEARAFLREHGPLMLKAIAATGTLSTYEPPSGPGLRVDGYGYAGYTVSPSFDSLLAKLVAHGSDYPTTLRRLYRALCEFRLTGGT
jgi:biotin carboxylase